MDRNDLIRKFKDALEKWAPGCYDYQVRGDTATDFYNGREKNREMSIDALPSIPDSELEEIDFNTINPWDLWKEKSNPLNSLNKKEKMEKQIVDMSEQDLSLQNLLKPEFDFTPRETNVSDMWGHLPNRVDDTKEKEKGKIYNDRGTIWQPGDGRKFDYKGKLIMNSFENMNEKEETKDMVEEKQLKLIKKNVKLVFDAFKRSLTPSQQATLQIRNDYFTQFPKIITGPEPIKQPTNDLVKTVKDVDLIKFAKYIQKKYF